MSRTLQELKLLQALPLEIKILKTQQRIREWVSYYGVDGVYISFSGGKDSTVLLHLVRDIYPNIEAVFVNTGLEFPEIQNFVKQFDNVTVIYPKKKFKDIISEYGYPVLSKTIAHNVGVARRNPYGNVMINQFNPNKKGIYSMYKWLPLINTDFLLSEKCCIYNKESPALHYQKETGKFPFVGTCASESQNRQDVWIKYGCNAFNSKNPKSAPLSFWTEQDILRYIKEYNINIAPVYGDIVTGDEQLMFEDCGGKLCTTQCDRTGCIYCGFGTHLEKHSRFLRLKNSHPKQYQYCIGGGSYDDIGIWRPNENGLGMGHVFDELNNIYGNNFIVYK